MNKVICKLTSEEVGVIRNIYEKKIALENLSKIITPSENEKMYERLVCDYGATVHAFNIWWDNIFTKHSLARGNYTVDFRTNEVVLAGK